MSFWKKLFGGGSETDDASTGAPVKQVEHNGFTISATPFKAEGQFQTCGVITKVVDGETREHRFIRADRFPGINDAADVTIRKGIQLINEQGDRIFG